MTRGRGKQMRGREEAPSDTLRLLPVVEISDNALRDEESMFVVSSEMISHT